LSQSGLPDQPLSVNLLWGRVIGGSSFPAHLELPPVLSADPEPLDCTQARGLFGRGQDLADPLAPKVDLPAPEVG
jgi:hypothetical protein